MHTLPTKTIIVAGITRSGLTMMMQFLYKGGYPCYGTWPAFEDYDIFKIDWEKAKGKAIKAVDTQLNMPPEGEYLVIRMRRDIVEQSKSILKFGSTLGFPVDRDVLPMIKEGLERDYKTIDPWAQKQHRHITVDFEEMLAQPVNIKQKIEEAFGISLGPKAVDSVLKRGPECYKGLLEISFLDDEKTYKMGTFTMGRCSVIVSKDNGKWHLSISTPTASPSYKEIKEARYRFIPNGVTMAQLFPPKEQFLNLHPYCHHLYEIDD